MRVVEQPTSNSSGNSQITRRLTFEDRPVFNFFPLCGRISADAVLACCVADFVSAVELKRLGSNGGRLQAVIALKLFNLPASFYSATVEVKRQPYQCNEDEELHSGDSCGNPVHFRLQLQISRSTSRRLINPFQTFPPALFQRRISSQAPELSPALSFFSSVEDSNALTPTL